MRDVHCWGVTPQGIYVHTAWSKLVPVCLCACPGPSELIYVPARDLVPLHVRSHLVHRAPVLLRVSTVVAFCAGGGAVGAKAEITVSLPFGVHLRASPEGMPAHVGT